MHDIPPDPTGLYEHEIWLMRAMGWSWAEMMNTPKNVIDELSIRISAENKWTSKRHEMDKMRSNR